jgi:formate dehydrogenase subunit gamma
MDLLRYGRSPWGERILTHVSWNLFWASLFAGILFFLAHAAYMLFSAHRKRSQAETDRLEAARPDLPPKIERHSLAARLFHWVMAASMFVLLFTAFLPVAGVKFPWVQWHWIAGLVLTASILYHIIHATFFLDFWSIWVGPKDIPEFRAEILRELGHEVPGPKPGKYPLGNRLYHLAIVVTGFAVTITGLFMLKRVRTPFFIRNPYIFSDSTWGFTYVLHGLAGTGLVGLVIAHVYFAVRPDKWWITKSMILGWITRRQYLEHHEPSRWIVGRGTQARPSTPKPAGQA